MMGMMWDDQYRPPRKRNEHRPVRAFLEVHPTLVRTIIVLVAAGCLIFLTVSRLILKH